MSQALYQKYRPQTFDQVIGQDEVVSYFKKIIEKDKDSVSYGSINHAYLLTGGRGTGKTTLARIFARGLDTDDIDIIELDTASNRGIDEIKGIREATLARPIASRYKVFILDEAHMITPHGANALLKTLEEPTPWTIFILCTTDPEKLISTIVSRTQVLNLNTPTEQSVATLLERINVAESLDMTDDNIVNIAHNHHESYRDAVGVLERLSGLETSKLNMHLGLDYDLISFEIAEFIIKNDLKSCFIKIEEINNVYKNINYEAIYKSIISIYRMLLLIKVGIDIQPDDSIKYSESVISQIKQLATSHKDKIKSETLKKLLLEGDSWRYETLNSREKLELVIMNVI